MRRGDGRSGSVENLGGVRLGAFGQRLVLGTLLGLLGCRAAPPGAVEMTVRNVGVDATSNAPVVLLEERNGTRTLPIWIGASEAQGIAMQLEGAKPPRPLTLDLLKGALDGVGAEVTQIAIVALQEGIYRAKIVIRSGDRQLDLDSRPSDAIALALLYRQPVRVDPSLLQAAAPATVRRQEKADTLKLEGVTVQNLTTELAEVFGISAGRGVLVADVDTEVAGGLQRGDVIVEAQHKSVYSVRELEAAWSAAKATGRILFEVHRGSEVLSLQLPTTAANPTPHER